jgi:predicted secreted protein
MWRLEQTTMQCLYEDTKLRREEEEQEAKGTAGLSTWLSTSVKQLALPDM